MPPWTGQAVHGAGEDGQGHVTPTSPTRACHNSLAHVPDPPHIPGRGLWTQTVLDTTCSRSTPGTAAVFSRKMLQGCDTSLPRQKCETGTFSVQPDPSHIVQFTFHGEGTPLSIPGKPRMSQEGLPNPSFLHGKQENKHKGRKGNPAQTHHQI